MYRINLATTTPDELPLCTANNEFETRSYQWSSRNSSISSICPDASAKPTWVSRYLAEHGTRPTADRRLAARQVNLPPQSHQPMEPQMSPRASSPRNRNNPRRPISRPSILEYHHHPPATRPRPWYLSGSCLAAGFSASDPSPVQIYWFADPGRHSRPASTTVESGKNRNGAGRCCTQSTARPGSVSIFGEIADASVQWPRGCPAYECVCIDRRVT